VSVIKHVDVQSYPAHALNKFGGAMDSTLCRIYSSHIVVDRLATLKAD